MIHLTVAEFRERFGNAPVSGHTPETSGSHTRPEVAGFNLSVFAGDQPLELIEPIEHDDDLLSSNQPLLHRFHGLDHQKLLAVRSDIVGAEDDGEVAPFEEQLWVARLETALVSTVAAIIASPLR